MFLCFYVFNAFNVYMSAIQMTFTTKLFYELANVSVHPVIAVSGYKQTVHTNWKSLIVINSMMLDKTNK